MDGIWGESNSLGQIYEIIEEDFHRVGDCWMKNRLLVGDLVLCHKHSGDHFYDYIVLKKFDNGLRGICQSDFGAYSFHKESNITLAARDFHLLMAGEFIKN